jgi:hypothetical protein
MVIDFKSHIIIKRIKRKKEKKEKRKEYNV